MSDGSTFNIGAVWKVAYLAIFELEGKDHLVAIYLFLDDLGSNPALSSIGLPGSRANIKIC